ncbi:DUF3298 domain-containing protein [Mycobacterium sp. NPDC051198]
MRHWIWVAAAFVIITPFTVNAAGAEPAGNTDALISGKSPDGLGTWTVHYQHFDGTSPVASIINDRIDDEANREVQQATWNGSTRRPWTFDATGTMNVRPTTVSEIFVGQYNTDEPNMPMQSLGSVVCDSRSGAVITWDNLFQDKTSGLIRLSAEVEARLAPTASPNELRDWRRSGQFAPIDVNFKYWVATPQGIELHFPPLQFGGGLKIVTVPWASMSDQITPEFAAITE